MPPAAPPLEKCQKILRRLHAKIDAWQLQALYLGAQTSTNLRLGPQHLLDRIFGKDPILGASVKDANANLQVLMGFWNDLLNLQKQGRIRLSKVALASPPTVDELCALAERREEEIVWFSRGIDAGGDDPIEFGDDGQFILKKLAEAGAFCASYRELLRRKDDHSAEELRKAGQTLNQLTGTIEQMIFDLMEISNDVRRRAIEEFRAMQGHRTDDGKPIARPIKVGRNEPCPCGSGRKWKRCCGAPERLQ